MQYPYTSAGHTEAHGCLVPALLRVLQKFPGKRVFEVGCGNGSVANVLSQRGYEVVGVDPSASGIAEAQRAYPHLQITIGDGYQDLASMFGQFPIVVSLEVVEHVYDPRLFARRCFDVLEPGGSLILSTPFHGYWKNLALAVSGKMDAHFTALWDGGHIKFWSEKTLRQLLVETGFSYVRFTHAGRIPPLARSMLALATRPRFSLLAPPLR